MNTPRREPQFEKRIADHQDPYEAFSELYLKARLTEMDHDPTVMALATASRLDDISVRYVLFKGINEGHILFATNHKSTKRQELTENPHASVAFYWHHLYVQIRIKGKVKAASSHESDIYWKTRPLPSQLSSTLSQQSQILKTSYESLVELFQSELARAEENQLKSLPRPQHWGAFHLVPSSFEFWFGHEHRLHRRVIFKKSRASKKWTKLLYYP